MDKREEEGRRDREERSEKERGGEETREGAKVEGGGEKDRQVYIVSVKSKLSIQEENCPKFHKTYWTWMWRAETML